MSSASRTTSSSRLSQFGIYRSIDARTEEFLRLSRKRQIRQGCACAAVSTAITVTIVITVLLVYEYTMNMDSNPTLKSRMAAWHGIFNDTSPFEVKYSKSNKVNLDPTTLKLLPLVLKALNQNRNLDKIAENIYPVPEPETSKNVIEHGFKKKLFQESKLKPHRILNTSDFKAFPAVVYKNTFNNVDYYKKIRQANDYNRMLNYFDKMINMNTLDRSASTSDEINDNPSNELSTQTPLPNNTKEYIEQLNNNTESRNSFNETSKRSNFTKSTRKPYHIYSKYTPTKKTGNENTHLSKKLNFGDLLKKKYFTMPHNVNQTLSPEPSTMKVANLCKCSKQLSHLLNKLFTDIQKILPEIELYKLSCSSDNNKSKFPTNKSTLPTTAIPIIHTTRKTSLVTKLSSIRQKMFSTLKPKFETKILRPYNIKEHLTKSKPIEAFTLRTHFDLKSNSTYVNNNNKKVILTTMKAFIEPTYTTQEFEGLYTKPMSTAKSEHTRKNKIESKGKNAHKNTTSTSTTTTTLPLIEDLENDLYFSNLDQHRDDDITSEKNEQPLNVEKINNEDMLSHQHETIFILPLMNKKGTIKTLNPEGNEQNKTIIIEWFNKLQKNNSQDLLLHPKERKEPIYVNKVKEKPKNYLTERLTKIKNHIEPKIYELNIFDEINEYQNKNVSLPRKKIHPIWPEEDGYTNITNEKIVPIAGVNQAHKTSKTTATPVINGINPKLYLSLLENIKDKTKRENMIIQQITTLHEQKNNSEHKNSKNIMKISNNTNISDISQSYTVTPVPITKNTTESLKSFSKAFFSKFADINDLLYQTKNISNVTIYAKFNFGNISNHIDDNTLTALQYDEFKFLNDEVQESEGFEGNYSKVDKYETFKSYRHNSDDSRNFIESMIPVSRPIFLEIQRSDWKHDTTNQDPDYGSSDTNFE